MGHRNGYVDQPLKLVNNPEVVYAEELEAWK